jgi:hypothetical protein
LQEDITTGVIVAVCESSATLWAIPQRKEFENRLKVIDFFDEYGAKATRKSFNESHSTVYLWKQKLKSGQGRLTSLSPGNRAL